MDEQGTDGSERPQRASSTPKWIAALVVTAVLAAGAAWFVTDRAEDHGIGQPVAATSTTSPPSTTAGHGASSDAGSDAASAPSWLFSTTAANGTFGANALDPTVGTLTLTGTDAQVTGFTDRPDRDTVLFPPDKLVAAWPTLFADSDPNAVLVTHDAAGATSTSVLELSSPTVDGTTLTFQVAAIEGKDHSSQLPGMTAVPATVPPASFGAASLFIDNVITSVIWVCKDGSGATIGSPPPSPGSPTAPGSGFYAECIKNGGTPSKQ
jgi:hypothetical protein